MPGCCCCMPLLHNHLMDSCSYVRKIHYYSRQRGVHLHPPYPPLNPPLKLMLITARSSTTTQRLHSFKFTLVNKSHSQHSEAAVRCLGRHFIICTHAHTKSRSQTKDHSHWSGSETSPKTNFACVPCGPVDKMASGNVYWENWTLIMKHISMFFAIFSASPQGARKIWSWGRD